VDVEHAVKVEHDDQVEHDEVELTDMPVPTARKPIVAASSLKVFLSVLFLFLALGLGDLFLTWKLIQEGDGRLIESNPVAGWWLATYGWAGMAAYKLGLFVVIGALAGVIAYRRPATGERLLVFGCGAQSAVVLYSVLLVFFVEDQAGQSDMVVWPTSTQLDSDSQSGGPRPYPRGALPENGMMLLLGLKGVQEELKLSESQAKSVGLLAGYRTNLRNTSRNMSSVNWSSQVQHLLAREKELLDSLEPEQAARLQQLAWQQRGPMAFGDPELGDALGMTAEQKESIRTILEAAKKARPGPGHGRGPGFGPDAGPRQLAARSNEEEQNKTKNQLLAVLTPDQQAHWKEMTGEPFKGELNPRPSGPPGFNRDARRGRQ
jgi:hypothetical protein